MFGVYYSAVFLYVEILIHRFSQIYTDFVDYTDLHRFSQISPLVFTFSKSDLTPGPYAPLRALPINHYPIFTQSSAPKLGWVVRTTVAP
jgi:hypothetical protein